MTIGVMHLVRRMAKVVHSFKILMLCSQFKHTVREVNEVRDVAILYILVYCKARIMAPLSASAHATIFSL